MTKEQLLKGATLVRMDEAHSVGKADVLLRDGRIAWIGPAGRAPRQPRGAERQSLGLEGCALLPGFVQLHVHLAQWLFRGRADDLPLLDWLRQRIWPLEAAHDARSLRASAQLGVSELLRGGTTTLLDMGTVHLHDVVFEVLLERGVRAMSGKALMDRGRGVPRRLRQSTRDSLRETEALARRWHGAGGGRLRYAHAPRFVLSCSERLMRGVAALAAEQGTWIHTHAAEHPAERLAVINALGESDVRHLDKVGLLGPRSVLAHGVQLTRAEMRLLARRGARVAHCPSTNLKLASGIADVLAMQQVGIRVGIGADGAPCNNRMDALGEARLAALLSKARRGDARALDAHAALRLITIEGARALDLADEIGSIEVGKRADLVAVRVDGLHQVPSEDVVSSLAYASTAEDVRYVWVEGELRVDNGDIRGVDVSAQLHEATCEARKTSSRAGL